MRHWSTLVTARRPTWVLKKKRIHMCVAIPMKLSLFFAKRYLFSKKSVNAINIISTISVVGVLVSSAALVIVLSFYNGMENLILSLYSTFAPELRIEPAKGKV